MAGKIDIKRPGLLHKKLGVPEGKPIPEGKIQAAKNSKDPKLRKEATFAENAKHFNHKGPKKVGVKKK